MSHSKKKCLHISERNMVDMKEFMVRGYKPIQINSANEENSRKCRSYLI